MKEALVAQQIPLDDVDQFVEMSRFVIHSAMSDEVRVVSRCFDVGAYNLAVNPEEYDSLYDFLAVVKEMVEKEGSEGDKETFAKIDLSCGEVKVNEETFTWTHRDTEHGDYGTHTYILIEYVIVGSQSGESEPHTIEIQYGG